MQQQQDGSDLWFRHMLAGSFSQAWAVSDEVLKARAGIPCWHLPRHQQYIWNGSPLNDQVVLIRCYHGLGDTIQFIRYAPMVSAIAKKVIIWAQPELIPLLCTVPGIGQIIPLHNGDPGVAYDVDVEIMELQHVFRSTIPTLPCQIPYLHVSAQDGIRHQTKKSIGLVWQAGDWDQTRSVPFRLLLPLFDLPDYQFYILQSYPEATGWIEGYGINPGPLNLYDYARCIKGLDVVISVDSMPAHLAGALGVPVWTLLKKDADWRWMENRTDSPWYPTMTLFRQSIAGYWTGVIEQVGVELKNVVAESGK